MENPPNLFGGLSKPRLLILVTSILAFLFVVGKGDGMLNWYILIFGLILLVKYLDTLQKRAKRTSALLQAQTLPQPSLAQT